MARVVRRRRISRCVRVSLSFGDSMTANVSGIGSVLQQMRRWPRRHQAASRPDGGTGRSGAATASTFASAMKASLDKISGDQQHALGEAQAFEVGAPNVSLNDVMVDMQKANIGFQFERSATSW